MYNQNLSQKGQLIPETRTKSTAKIFINHFQQKWFNLYGAELQRGRKLALLKGLELRTTTIHWKCAGWRSHHSKMREDIHQVTTGKSEVCPKVQPLKKTVIENQSSVNSVAIAAEINNVQNEVSVYLYFSSHRVIKTPLNTRNTFTNGKKRVFENSRQKV